MLSFKSLSCLLGAALLFLQPVSSNLEVSRFEQVRQAKLNQAAKFQLQSKASNSTCNSKSCYRYYTNDTAPYFIESWPDVSFPTGEFYGGNVPIDNDDPSRALFFIFKPSMGPPVDEVTIWLNGGPGCSSLEGFFEENGPILWQPGTNHPRQNQWTWAKMTNMLWVEQPVGTGFATGKVTAKNEVDVAKDFVAFFENWQKIFGIKNYKIYITGESYAGRYVPYIGAQMLDEKNTEYFDLKGAMMYDPCIGDCYEIAGVIPTYQFVEANNDILTLNETFLSDLKQVSTECGWEAYLDKYLQFPPPEHQPTVDYKTFKAKCDTGQLSYDAITELNPCYNIYHITDYCPLLYDSLTGPNRYFNRLDVKKAIHAPLNVTWTECSRRDVFNKTDHSPNSIDAVLPQVIEATNRVLVSNAQWDGLIYTNGTMLSIQNMTWNGKLGFQRAPTADFVVTESLKYYGPQGIMGKKHYERGLAWVETYQAGHMQPEYQPRVTWQQLEWLLGRISDL